MANEMVVPDYMKKFMNQSQQDAASMATSSISVPRLSYRGKRFRFVESGEEELVKDLTVKVIVVGVEPDAGKFIKTYYEKGYQPGDTDPPSCSSSDGIRPDVWVTSKQAELCAQCLKNVFGSATSMSGGKAKACKDGKRLWVTKPDDPGKFYALNVPVMSLKNLSEYGKYIGRNNYPLALVITELGMDDASEFPKLTFNHVGFVEEAVSEIVAKLNTDRPWKSISVIEIEYDGPKASLTPQPALSSNTATKENIDDVVGKW